VRLLIFSDDDKIVGYNEFAEALGQFGVEAICARSLKYCFLSENRPLDVVPTPKMLMLVKRFNPDVVFTDSPYYIPYMAKLVSRFVLYHMRYDVWSEVDVDRTLYPSLLARTYTSYLATIKTRSIKKADLILPNSRWLQKQLKKHLPNHPSQVLYVGINSEEWIPQCDQALNVKHPAVAGVFQFNIYAKFLGLLKFLRVIRKMPDVNFYFAGTGPYMNLIKKTCPSNLHLVGRVARSEIKALLKSCDLFVHPSGLDALPRSVKEASLMEKPIVASNVGGIPEMVINNETGYLCNIDDTDQWIRKIRFLLENPDIAKEFGKRARRFVEKTFNWRKIAEDFMNNLCLNKSAS
jgi:glycosyltransferase involved in cell wall biosynthesis